MAIRVKITTYEQAFEGILNITIDSRIEAFLKQMERAGYTERSIAFTIWKKQDKLYAYRRDNRFLSILENEVKKWSWGKDDPRWEEYYKRKEEERRAAAIREEIDAVRKDKFTDQQLTGLANSPPKKPKGYVYFIQGLCGGAIKIGYSVCPEKRLQALQTGYPDTLTILLMIPGNESIETSIHHKFRDSKLKGEWFRPDAYLIDGIKELKAKFARCGA